MDVPCDGRHRDRDEEAMKREKAEGGVKQEWASFLWTVPAVGSG